MPKDLSGQNGTVVPEGWEKRQCALTGRQYYSGKLSGRLRYEVPEHADDTEGAAALLSPRAEIVRLQISLEQSEKQVIELRDQLIQAQATIRELERERVCVSGPTGAADDQPTITRGKQEATGTERFKALDSENNKARVTVQKNEGIASSNTPMEADGFSDPWYSRNVGIKAERMSKEDFLGPDSPWLKAVTEASETTRGRSKALDPKRKVPVTLHQKVRAQALRPRTLMRECESNDERHAALCARPCECK